MKVYLNDKKTFVDPRLLYDILWGLKALCGNTTMQTFDIDQKCVKTLCWIENEAGSKSIQSVWWYTRTTETRRLNP
jgi:hypothetical protein